MMESSVCQPNSGGVLAGAWALTPDNIGEAGSFRGGRDRRAPSSGCVGTSTSDFTWTLHAQHDDAGLRVSSAKMNIDEYNTFCGSLPAATYVNQWGGSHVWKIGPKVFAIGGWANGEPAFTFKVSEIAFELLREQPGLRPAPYLASRGMKWIQHYAMPGLSDEELRDCLGHSRSLVSRGLTKKLQRELGLVT